MEDNDWLPIESAPADTDLLLCWWQEWPSNRWHYEAAWASASNTCGGGYSNGWAHGSATHWKRLPAPPENTP